MTQQIIARAPRRPDVYCYDDVTDADEVNRTLHDIVRQYKQTCNVWIVSGTHGTAAGTVDPLCKETDFKKQDVSSANVTSKNIKILDYHLLSPNRWADVAGKAGATNVIVLAFCYSQQWFNNLAPLGNNGKL
jgi:NAD-dependent SIR2 family protein deacetylase